MKLGHLIEYNKRNIFSKDYEENEAGRLVSDLFLCLKNVQYEVKANGLRLTLNIFWQHSTFNTIRSDLAQIWQRLNFMFNGTIHDWLIDWLIIAQNEWYGNSEWRLGEILLWKTWFYNHFHNILRFFDVLANFSFITSETMRDYCL